MKLSVSAFRGHASAHEGILTTAYQQQYSGAATQASEARQTPHVAAQVEEGGNHKSDDEVSAKASSTATKKSKMTEPKTKTTQGWSKLRRTIQINSAIQKKPPLNRADSFLEKFSTLQLPENKETVESISGSANSESTSSNLRRRKTRILRTVVNPEKNSYYYWHWLLSLCVMYNLWAIIVRHSFHELQNLYQTLWTTCDIAGDMVFALDIVVQFRTSYLEQGLMVYDSKKLALHYLKSKSFIFDFLALLPLELVQMKIGIYPIARIHRLLKSYRAINWYYMVESRTSYPNVWRVVNLVHVLLFLTHWFGCFYYMISKIDRYQDSTNTTHNDWTYPLHSNPQAPLSRQYLGSIYWSTLTLTTIGDLPMPQKNIEQDGASKLLAHKGRKSRLLLLNTNTGFVFTIMSYLIGVFIFATIVGQVGSVITNRNANRLEYERLLDSAKAYMRHHKVPSRMKRRVIRWYDYSWSRGRIHGGDQLNNALGHLPIKLKTDLALHINLRVLKKVTIFQECQPQFLHDLVLKMKAYVFTPGDAVCRRGDIAREMFIIVDGVLKVIAANGKVLTVMEAGEFFGEIGILNLDGLNKRTADVISVGYSELFSLSREDVLTALHDYPEAYEKLQDLGKKRLQEAKILTKQKSKPFRSPDNSSGEDNGHKKLLPTRIDLKSIRNQIRNRSRLGQRTCGSLELPAGVGKELKMLQKMPRGKSDDSPRKSTEENNQESSSNVTDETKIGAGLPLLARLKLYKELQERKEEEQKLLPIASALTLSSQNTTLSNTSSDVNNLQVLQRFILNKTKDEGIRDEAAIKLSVLKRPQSPTLKFSNILKNKLGSTSTDKLMNNPLKLIRKSSSPGESNFKSRVTFKDTIHQSKSDNITVPQVEETTTKPINSFVPGSTTTVMLSNLRSHDKANAKSNIENISKHLSKQSAFEMANNVQMPSSDREQSLTNTYSVSNNKNQHLRKDNLKSVQNKQVYCFKAIDIEREPEITPIIENQSTQKSKSSDNLTTDYNKVLYKTSHMYPNDKGKNTEIKIISSSLNNLSSSSKLHRDYLTKSVSEDNKIYKHHRKRRLSDPSIACESNDSLEKQTLKSILKNISDVITLKGNCNKQFQLEQLIQEPTLKGYAARRSKLTKNIPCHSLRTGLLRGPLKNSNILKTGDSSIQSTSSPLRKNIKLDTEHESITKKIHHKPITSHSDLHSSKKCQSFTNTDVKSIDVSVDELLVIKQAIQNNLQNLQRKSYDRCLPHEIEKRDKFICKLLIQIQKLENRCRSNRESLADEECRKIRTDLFVRPLANGGMLRTESICVEPALTTTSQNTNGDVETDPKHTRLMTGSACSDSLQEKHVEFARNIKHNESRKDLSEKLTNNTNIWESLQIDSYCNEVDLDTDDNSFNRRKSWSSNSKKLNPESSRRLISSSPHPTLGKPEDKLADSSVLNKTTIKKTLSVDTGMHHTRLCRKSSVSPKHRKFSLGSLFGASRRSNSRQEKCSNDVVIDICDSRANTDNALTSDDFDKDYGATTTSRIGNITSYEGYSRNVSNWEVMMLAEELEKIEQRHQENIAPFSPSSQREFEEEDDCQTASSDDDSSDPEVYNPSSIINFLSSPSSFPYKFFEMSSVRRRDRNIDSRRRQSMSVTRAASLDSQSSSSFSLTRRFNSLYTHRTD